MRTLVKSQSDGYSWLVIVALMPILGLIWILDCAAWAGAYACRWAEEQMDRFSRRVRRFEDWAEAHLPEEIITGALAIVIIVTIVIAIIATWAGWY